MQITPKTPEEIAMDGLLPAGTYPFEVIDAEEKTSKSGNQMIVLKTRVFHGERTQFIDDYLLEKIAHKLRHAVLQLVSEEAYNSGMFSADQFRNKNGWAKVGIQKDKTGAYPPKNVILDYVEKPDASANPVEEEDNIPW